MNSRVNYMQQVADHTQKLFELSQISKKSSLGKELLTLVDIRASLMNGCAFCLDMHVKEAKLQGERELPVYHVPVWRESTLFSDREKAAMEWTEAVTKLSEHGISDELFSRVKEHFSDKEISELTFAVGIINLWNRLSISFKNVPGSGDAALGLTKSGLQ